MWGFQGWLGVWAVAVELYLRGRFYWFGGAGSFPRIMLTFVMMWTAINHCIKVNITSNKGQLKLFKEKWGMCLAYYVTQHLF